MIVSPAAETSTLTLVAPPVVKTTVEVATVNGTGCPIGTAAAVVAPDNDYFTVLYSDYMAQIGLGINPTDIRQNCQLSLRVKAPAGYTYAITRADYAGYIHLADGVTAVQKANYYIQGESETATISHPFAGPADNGWATTDYVALSELADEDFAPCGEQRNLNINTELRIGAGSSDSVDTSFISMDSTSGQAFTKYHFVWRQC